VLLQERDVLEKKLLLQILGAGGTTMRLPEASAGTK